MLYATVALLFLLIGGYSVYLFMKKVDENNKKSAQSESDKILTKAKSEAARIEKDAKNKAKDFEVRARKNVESDIQKQKAKLKSDETKAERRLQEIEEQHKQRLAENEKTVQQLNNQEKELKTIENRLIENDKTLNVKISELQQKLERAAQLSKEDAKRELLQTVEEEAKILSLKKVEEIEKQAEVEADKRAKRILAVAMARFASEYTSERTVTVMSLPSDEMKGKIIGREGRNIRTLEAHCGVDLIVDDTPESVVISGFDPIRRELAKRTIEKLMDDGRVHPARIEEVVEKVKVDLLKSVKEEGDKVCVELGVSNLHVELVKLLGALKFRHSHTQNVLNHSLEVAHLSGLMAAEMGVNVKIAQRAGLLHDIGKAVDHTVEGSHAIVGADVARKYGESEQICHAIRAHHNEEKPNSVLAFIVQTANTLSNSRPGARRPGMDNFINRLQDLESIGNSFDGVLRTYALQAGRDIRVMVEASKITDEQSQLLNKDIIKKIERELPHLGSVKVSVFRETRAVELAR